MNNPIGIFDSGIGGLTVVKELIKLIRDNFALKPKEMIEMLNLKRPIFQKTAAYGHFGREEEDFSWEKTDKAEALKKAAS